MRTDVGIRDEIIKWCKSYVRGEYEALCLAEMIFVLFNKHRKTSFAVGFMSGIIFWSILIHWLS